MQLLCLPELEAACRALQHIASQGSPGSEFFPTGNAPRAPPLVPTPSPVRPGVLSLVLNFFAVVRIGNPIHCTTNLVLRRGRCIPGGRKIQRHRGSRGREGAGGPVGVAQRAQQPSPHWHGNRAITLPGVPTSPGSSAAGGITFSQASKGPWTTCRDFASPKGRESHLHSRWGKRSRGRNWEP